MKNVIAFAFLLLSCIPISAQQTQSSVQTQINSNITTNGQNQITGAKLNSVLTTINGAIFQGLPSTSVSFKQQGIGAYATTVQAKLSQIELSIDDYYSGSGTYDTAILNAIAAIPSGGGTIIFQPGTTYTFANAIPVNRGNILFKCKGVQTCTITTTSTTSDIFSVNQTTYTTSLTTNGTTTSTVASNSNLTIGMEIASTEVSAGTTITNIAGTTITLSTAATGTGTDAGAIFGNYYFNIYWDGFVFAKQNVSTSGCDINIKNVGYFGISNSRFYGNLTSWNHLCLVSASELIFENNVSDNPINSHITMAGISANQGTLNGSVTDVVFAGFNKFIGGHGATANPLSHGAIEVSDFTNGLFFNNVIAYQYKGYAIKMTGTSAGGANNTLIFIENPNFEADYAGSSGGFYATYYNNVSITHGWMSGYGVPTIYWDTGSDGLTVTGLQLATNGTATSTVSIAGTHVSLTGNDFNDYNAGTGYGVGLGATANYVNVVGGHIRQMANGILSQTAGGSQQITVVGVQFESNSIDIDSTIYGSSNASVVGLSNAAGALNTQIGGYSAINQLAIGSTLTAASLPTPATATIAGSICATSAGSFIYKAGANCY